MAVKELTVERQDFNTIETITLEAATAAADGVKFKPKTSDEYVVILAVNTSDDTAYDVTVKAPGANGGYAAAQTDLKEEDIAAGGMVAIRVETARFADKAGYIKLVPENTAVKFAILD